MLMLLTAFLLILATGLAAEAVRAICQRRLLAPLPVRRAAGLVAAPTAELVAPAA